MPSSITQLIDLVEKHQPIAVLTGAGISTDSGIPAYRDQTGRWLQAKPIQARDFHTNPTARKRYWQRSMLGWPVFHSAKPNLGHDALVTLENNNIVSCIITQNVDGLHRRAGSRRLIELHGSLDTVVCLSCKRKTARANLQHSLIARNPGFGTQDFSLGADGDATPHHVSLQDIANFQPVNCSSCHGLLKPDVVFYGENVPTSRVEHCMEQLKPAGMLICAGSSLTLFSGFRFCRAAHRADQPIAIINLGETRADNLATCIVRSDCASTLCSILAALKLKAQD